jgi:predicted nucleotidyltransferase
VSAPREYAPAPPKGETEQEWAFRRAREVARASGLEPLFLAVRGSIAYDLPGTHRDIDVRAVSLAPTVEVLSLRKPDRTLQWGEGRLDFVSWEAERFLGHLLSHNGSMVEMLLSPERLVWTSERGEELRRLAPKFLTKKLGTYYRGYAHSQFKRAQQQIRTGKGAIYTYREMYAGIWLMVSGEVIFPWEVLRQEVEGNGLYRSRLLDEFNMDRERITEDVLARMRSEFSELTEILDRETERSYLARDYDAFDVLNRMLLGWRSRGWA